MFSEKGINGRSGYRGPAACGTNRVLLRSWTTSSIALRTPAGSWFAYHAYRSGIKRLSLPPRFGASSAHWRAKTSANKKADLLPSSLRQDQPVFAKQASRRAGVSPWLRPHLDLPESWDFVSVDQLTTLVQYGSSAKTTESLTKGVPVLRMAIFSKDSSTIPILNTFQLRMMNFLSFFFAMATSYLTAPIVRSWSERPLSSPTWDTLPRLLPI